VRDHAADERSEAIGHAGGPPPCASSSRSVPLASPFGADTSRMNDQVFRQRLRGQKRMRSRISWLLTSPESRRFESRGESALATRSCECGCATIDLLSIPHRPRLPWRGSQSRIEAETREKYGDARGRRVVASPIRARAWLVGLEIVYYGDCRPRFCMFAAEGPDSPVPGVDTRSERRNSVVCPAPRNLLYSQLAVTDCRAPPICDARGLCSEPCSRD
jgi:hypothetical protein